MLIILSGPSGCGKGTVLARLLAERNDTVLSVSATTRPPRPGDIDGVQYFFRTREEFEKMIADDALLEYAEYSGNYYGTPAPYVEDCLAAGKNVILEIEVQGALKVMQACPEHVSIFIGIPSIEELERRLRGRGTEAEDVIARRMEAAKRELATANKYQSLVINDDVEQAVSRLQTILEAESLRYKRMETKLLEVMNYA
jgi:guanylate kinase